MRKYFDSLSNPIDGRPIKGGQVSVLTGGGTAAPIFSDPNGSNPLAQPVITDDRGYYEFYIASGTYTLRLANGTSVKTIPNVDMTDATAGSVTSSAIIAALGYTPYDAANPAGFLAAGSINKATVGLGNVDNKSAVTIRGEGGSVIRRDSGFAMDMQGVNVPAVFFSSDSFMSFDRATGSYYLTSGGAGNVVWGVTSDGSMNVPGKLTVAADPTTALQVATKSYVDNSAQGLSPKAAVVAATTANITLSGAQTIDGVAVVAGNRVLVKDQSTPAQNGIYVAASGAWTRATDADVWAEVVGAYVFVSGGTAQGSSSWAAQAAAGGTLGTTALPFVQFNAAGNYANGTGLDLTGNVFSLATIGAGTFLANATAGTSAPSPVGAGTVRTMLSINNVENKTAATIRGEGGSPLRRDSTFYMDRDGSGNALLSFDGASYMLVNAATGTSAWVQNNAARLVMTNTETSLLGAFDVSGALTEAGNRVATKVALLAGTGSQLVGHQQSGGGAVLRTVGNKLLQDSLPTLRDRGGVGDGTTNDRASIAACDALGPFKVPMGFFLVSSSITIANNVTFEVGARLIIPNGVTVTFNGGITAPGVQIFNFSGTGAVAGLLDVDILWFAGDAWNNPATNGGRALAQKAYDACAQPAGGGATVRWPGGYMRHDGTAIAVTKGQQTQGTGKSSTTFLWTSTSTAGFAISGASFASIRGIGCSWGDYRLLPTSGIFISVSGVLGVEIEDVGSGVAYDAISFSGNSAGCTVNDFNFYESFNTGVTAQNVGDIFVQNFIINTNLVFLTTGAITGTFVVGETVQGSVSGKQAPIVRVNDTTFALGYVASAPQLFVAGETITGLTSGATATVSTVRIPHAAGGIRLADHVEAFIAEAGDIIGGQYPMVSDAASNTQSNRPAYCSFSDVYFDSGLYQCSHNNSVEFDFVDCWWSNRGHGAMFQNCDGFKFSGGKIVNCGGNGHIITASCTNFIYNGVSIRGNSTSATSLFSGLLFKAGASKFIVTGCIGDDAVLGYGTQKYAVEVEAGASDRYQIANNRFTAAQVSDGGTGVNKLVAANF